MGWPEACGPGSVDPVSVDPPEPYEGAAPVVLCLADLPPYPPYPNPLPLALYIPPCPSAAPASGNVVLSSADSVVVGLNQPLLSMQVGLSTGT